MRGLHYISCGLLLLVLLCSFLSGIDDLSSMRPNTMYITQHPQSAVHISASHPPLFSALLQRLQTWESQPEVEVQTRTLFPSTSELTLFANETTHTLGLATIDNDHDEKSAVGNVSFYTISSDENELWAVNGKTWELNWTMKVPGHVLNTLYCYDGSCICIVYKSISSQTYIDRVRLLTIGSEADFDDFQLPGSGKLTAVTVTNHSITYHRYQEVQSFVMVEKVHRTNVTEDAQVLLMRDKYAWVVSTSAIEQVSDGIQGAEVIGIQALDAMGEEWMILTSSFLPSISYINSEAQISTHLFYRTNTSDWAILQNFGFNHTFSPLLFQTQALSYAVAASGVSASVSLVSLEHTFMAYTWDEGIVTLHQLDVVQDVFPRFHVMDGSGTYALLITHGPGLVLLKKWREDNYIYQAAFSIDVSMLPASLSSLEIKSARLQSSENHHL